ncbi:MAG: DUF2059 domain-containing protein [Candidatus Omnitrophica bacterium]|nr:DUF2059 domain-containing protein [Candidatus Omnitrophota bacterium]
MKKRIGLLSGILLMISLGSSFAETVYFKNGNKITGKIIDETPEHIILRQGYIDNRYYHFEIESIEKDGLKENSAAIIPGNKLKLYRELFNVNGTRKSLEKMVNATVNSAPIDKKDQVSRLLNIDELLDSLIPVYEKYFYVDEIQDMVKFYKSPTGKKLIDKTPELMKSVMESNIEYFKKKLSK